MKNGRDRFSNIARSQARACRDAAAFILPIVLQRSTPADKLIASFFRNNKKYGSRDRQIIYEIIFAVFRWWGWIRKLGENGKWKMENERLNQAEDRPQNSDRRLQTEDNARSQTSQNCPSCPTESELNRILLAAALVEDRRYVSDEIASAWLDDLNLPKSLLTVKTQAGLNRKVEAMEQFFKYLRIEDTLDIKDLVPCWALPFLSGGVNLEKLIGFCQKRPPIWIRLNPTRDNETSREFHSRGISYSMHDKIKNALYINHSSVNLYSLESFNKGCFEIQDIASQCIGLACGAKPGQRWWDACAGAGGKSLQLSSLMANKGTIVASDIREYKLDDLKLRARRAGISNIQCREWDGKPLDSRKHFSFDGVLVDAPCSCSGTWRRNPDARWRMSANEVEELAATQLIILKNASAGVRKNGTLVYATCSIFEVENTGVVNKFLETNKDFTLSPFTNPLTGDMTGGTLQVLPWDADCDAMFVSRFVRI